MMGIGQGSGISRIGLDRPDECRGIAGVDLLRGKFRYCTGQNRREYIARKAAAGRDADLLPVAVDPEKFSEFHPLSGA